jgi:hypothetical protein
LNMVREILSLFFACYFIHLFVCQEPKALY